ncbi:Topoisomerase IA [Thermoplasmatales archaeon BRNA1]|nr:Topoisomerase IA [Thermoplasmatales archaeon BRNA1]
MKILIITEKANAARRIATILSDGKSHSASAGGVTSLTFASNGDEYNVVSLRGHIMELDYPEKYSDWKAVSPVELVNATQIKTVRVKSILSKISELSAKADEIIIATDYDREGELIGMETVKAAGVDMGKVKRAKFSALTKGEIENAFANLVEPDEKLAQAAEARQIVDLSWGAVLTRLISLSSGQVGKNFMSVGRVQSPTLKLLVDRNEEIENFVPVPYWTIQGRFGMLAFRGTHEAGDIFDREKAEAIYNRTKDVKEATVSSCEKGLKEEYRPPPFDTTMMQVEANKIGIPPSAAMKLAEDLYTGGYISYPRTENTEYPRTLSLKGVLEKLKDSEFAEEAAEILAQDRISPSRGKRRTTDHPPIYPTAGATQAKLKGDKWKLYELIVRRFMATVAPNAVAETTKAVIDVAGEKFVAEGYIQKEKGWKKYYGKYLRAAESRVPEMAVGEKIDVRSITNEESQTKPPYRYNQGSLIQEMDRLQLGTKSTRHDIIGKLFSRNYVQGNYLIPTASGIALTKALEHHGGGITEPEMTAKLEMDMLSIAGGEKSLGDVVEESQNMLRNVAITISNEEEAIGDEIKAALKKQQYVGVCPECGNSMTVKKSKNGNFIGCNGYPECKKAFPLPKGAMVQMTEDTCPECGLALIRVIRRGMPPSTQCIDPKCVSNTAKNDLGPCPTCGKGTIRVMFSKAGRRFAGCSEWPACTQTYPLRPRGTIIPTGNACPECGAPLISVGSLTECINLDCPSRKKHASASKTGTGTASPSADNRIGKVFTVVVADRKKSSKKSSSGTAKKKTVKGSKKSESPLLENSDDE